MFPRQLVLVPASLVILAALVFAAVMQTGDRVEASPDLYTVQPGDSVWAIAERFDVSPDAILSLNGIPDAHFITAGQQLAIPNGGSRVIGHSVEGRPIEVTCHGSGGSTVLVVGGIHTGSEANSVTLAEELQRTASQGGFGVPDGARLCVIPSLNPDGIVSGQRVNANGVDLNRNWPTDNWTPDAFHTEGGPVSGGTSPLSEPETQALYDYLLERQPSAVVMLHCCGALVEANAAGGASSLAQAYAGASGKRYLTEWDLHPITGQFLDAMDRLGIRAMDIEMVQPDGIDFAENASGVRAVLQAVAGNSGSGEASMSAGGTGGGSTYTIQPGDTLGGIALRLGVSMDALASANDLSSPYLIYAGATLRVP